MYAREFCYWLQGAFEVGSMPYLTRESLGCIKKHLALVEATDQAGQPKEALAFCNWLRGGADFIQHENMEQSDAVKKRLSEVFVYAIDPSYKEHLTLGPIHGPGMRC